MSDLIAYDKATGQPVAEGTVVKDFRGDEVVFIRAIRMNEMRYGGHRSGKILIRSLDGSFRREVYDKVCNLEIRNMELEGSQ